MKIGDRVESDRSLGVIRNIINYSVFVELDNYSSGHNGIHLEMNLLTKPNSGYYFNKSRLILLNNDYY